MMIISAVVILAVVAGSINVIPMLSMNPAPTGQISGTKIYAVKNVINSVFFIKTNTGYIMVDAGSDKNKLDASMRETGINAKNVKWILLTHSDSDHTTALTLFPDAIIYMGEDEFPLVNGSMKRQVFGGNKMPAGIDIRKIIPLKDNQILMFDETVIECIKAPGHTPGSMMYFLDERYLFTGDAFRLKNGSRDVHPFTMDAQQAKRTIGQLKETADNSLIVLTAHYGLQTK